MQFSEFPKILLLLFWHMEVEVHKLALGCRRPLCRSQKNLSLLPDFKVVVFSLNQAWCFFQARKMFKIGFRFMEELMCERMLGDKG